jgi:hypothetical protein
MRILAKFSLVIALAFILCMPAVAQVAPATTTAAPAVTTSSTTDTGDRYFLMSTLGAGPATGWRGEGSVGVRLATDIYSLTSMNLAGGVGAVTEDVVYRAASARGVTLWARAGAGVTTTNATTSTSTMPTFGGGAMVSYDLSRLKAALAGLEAVASCKIMYTSTTVDGAATTTVKPMYQIGLKYAWQ